jgi:hypothetical protein
MKRCPTCQSTYQDDSIDYCFKEGARLINVAPGQSDDPQATLFAQAETLYSNPSPEKELRSDTGSGNWGAGSGNWGTSWPSIAGQPAPSAPPEARKRSPLLVIIGGVLLLGAGLGAGYLVANNGLTETERKASETSAMPAVKMDAASLLTELKDLERQMTEASIKGDKTVLERILAEDYVATGADGKFYSKAQTLASTEPISVVSWSIDGAKLLSFSDTAATLTAVVTFKGATSVESQQITDTFTKRQGRWQIIASQSTLLK